jgi:hypothetical protein
MVQRNTIVVLAVILIAIAVATISFGYYLLQGNQLPDQENQELLAKLSPKIDNLLSAFNDDDYATFSEDFSTRMKTAFTQTAFNDARDQIIPAYGLFISKTSVEEVLKGETEGEMFIRIVYETKFDKKDPVYVVVSFLDSDPSYPVEGLWFLENKP